MTTRRGILGLILGAGSTAIVNPRVTVAEASTALGLPIGAPIDEMVSGMASPGLADDYWRFTELLQNELRRKREGLDGIPVHISTKRSWSPAFKVHVANQEARIIDAYMSKLNHDQKFRNKFLSSLGITVDD